LNFKKVSLSLLILLSLLIIRPSESIAFRRLSVGDDLSAVVVNSMDKTAMPIADYLGEKATLLLFFATWSPRSAEALADFERYFEDWSDNGLNVIAINVEHDTITDVDRELVLKAAQEAKVKYVLAVDEELKLYNRYGVSAVPSTALLDPKGKVTYILPGYPGFLRDELKEEVMDLIGILQAEKKPTPKAAVYKGKSERYYRMALLFSKKGMTARALETLDKALIEDPEHMGALELKRTLEGNIK